MNKYSRSINLLFNPNVNLAFCFTKQVIEFVEKEKNFVNVGFVVKIYSYILANILLLYIFLLGNLIIFRTHNL